jgi:hypothetical protein
MAWYPARSLRGPLNSPLCGADVNRVDETGVGW